MIDGCFANLFAFFYFRLSGLDCACVYGLLFFILIPYMNIHYKRTQKRLEKLWLSCREENLRLQSLRFHQD